MIEMPVPLEMKAFLRFPSCVFFLAFGVQLVLVKLFQSCLLIAKLSFVRASPCRTALQRILLP